MKKYFFRSQVRNIITTFQADKIFWSGSSIVFVRGNDTIAAIGLMPGDIIVEDGCWKDLSPAAKNPNAEEGLDSLVN